jgi:hypothetical protein
MSKIIFVTYASGGYKKYIFWNKLFVSIFIRPDKSFFYTDEDLHKTDFYKKHRDVFDAEIGAGYWAWKPWVILQAISYAEEGDVVLYQDCGMGLKYKNFVRPKNIIAYALKNDAMPGILVPIHGVNKHWTHDKCFQIMNCYNDKYFNSPMIEAAISAWKVSDKSQEFVNEWMSYCLDINVVGDGYALHGDLNNNRINHRYDQSVLTNLVIKRELKPLKLSFDDMHFSKSLSFVELDLRKSGIFLGLLLKINKLFKHIKRIIKC